MNRFFTACENGLMWFMDRFIGFLVIGICLFMVSCTVAWVFHKPPVTRTVPESSCHDTATGRTQEEHYTTFQCAGFDDKGNCTVQIPIDNTITRQEVSAVCSYTEWR